MAIVKDLARPESLIDTRISYGPDPDKIFKLPSCAGTTNATVIKALGGEIHMIEGLVTVASARYIKFYDLARLPVVGTDVPKLTVACPASTGFALNEEGLPFDTGIAMAITTLPADNDATAPAAGDITGLDVTYE